jgi:hypothetical protein
MNALEYFLSALFFSFALFFAVVSVQELFERKTSPKYRDLTGSEIVIVKLSCSFAGLAFAGFFAYGGVYFWKQAGKKPK